MLAAVTRCLVWTALAAAAHAQCAPQWQPGLSVPGLDWASLVHDTLRCDPDGVGPLGEVLVFSSNFAAAGSIAAQNVAAFDPTSNSWHAFGSGIPGFVYAMAATPSGGLTVVGSFSLAGGQPAANAARWDGSQWLPLGTGPNDGLAGAAYACTYAGNGDLVVGGAFTAAGGLPIQRLARFDGTGWQPIGGDADDNVLALVTMPSGDVVAAGTFRHIGGVPLDYVARWNGAHWLPVGPASNWGAPSALACSPSGELVAARFLAPSGGTHVTRFDGTQWLSLGQAFGTVHELAYAANGDLVAVGSFTSIAGVPCNGVARWNGAVWQAVAGQGLSIVNCVECWPSGDLFVGGQFGSVDGIPATSLARWDGGQWHALATGTSGGYAAALCRRANGELAMGGAFSVLDGAAARNVAVRDATGWRALGNGWGITVRALTDHHGDLIAGGYAYDTGQTPLQHVMRWDGAQWHPLGGGVDYDVLALLSHSSGELWVGGSFGSAGGVPSPGLARWTGQAWLPMGGAFVGATRTVRALLELPNGDVVVGGSFRVTTSGGLVDNLARWDGSAWHALGGSADATVGALALLTDGSLVAAGSFATLAGQACSRIARWNGSGWSPLGTGLNNVVTSLAALPDGGVAAGGYFTAAGSTWMPRTARWNGSGWSSFGGGPNDAVFALLMQPDGDLVVGGGFTTAGGRVAKVVTALQPPCRAAATTLPSGCVGPSPTLRATRQAWLGGAFGGRAEGLASGSFAFAAFGFAMPPTPLSVQSSLGEPGCLQLAGLASLTLAVPSNGSLDTALAVPNLPALVGAQVRHQVWELATDGLGAATALRISPALDLTVGRF